MAEVAAELTYNWDTEDYQGGRNFGHLAYAVDDIYATCQRLLDGGVTINRPPRDGHMAFIRSPDNINASLASRGKESRPRTRAIVIYPMNALANSQVGKEGGRDNNGSVDCRRSTTSIMKPAVPSLP
eukprot:gene68131-biopygen50075